MTYLYIVTAMLLGASFVRDKGRTKRALQIAAKRLITILPQFLTMLVFVSIFLYLVPDSMILRYLGGPNKWFGLVVGSILGSITIMPGFIAFPLSGVLVGRGVAYMAIGAFTTTLMMVGVLTFPVEQRYLGTRLAVLRNVISLAIALVVALSIGLVYGEVF